MNHLGTNWGARRAEQFPHRGNYTLTPDDTCCQLLVMTSIHCANRVDQFTWRFCTDVKFLVTGFLFCSISCNSDYLRLSVHFYTPSRNVRSTNQLLLSKPTTRTLISLHTFSRAAPTIWNSLPHHICVADSFGRFRQLLRTHLYLLAFH